MTDVSKIRPQSLMATHPIRGLWLTTFSFLVSDTFALSFGASIAVVARWAYHGKYDPYDYLRFAPALALFVIAFALTGLYPGIALNPVDEMRRVLYSITVGHLVILAITYLFKSAETYSRAVFLITWVVTVVLVIVCRTVLRATLARKRWWGVPAVILGAGETGQLVLKTLQKRPWSGLKAAAILDESLADWPAEPRWAGDCFWGGFDWAPVLARNYRLSYAIVAMPEVPCKQLSALLSRYAQDFRHLLIIPDLIGMTTLGVCTRDLGGLVGLEISHKLVHRVPQIGKRALDLTLAGCCAVLLFPVFLLICLGTRLSGPGQIFYGQRRIGRGKLPFTAWKFRSMVPDADAVLAKYLESDPEMAEQWRKDRKLRHDPRITPLGRFLRKTSLDELPQLWNIIRGDMSLVGPRPIVEGEVEKYGEAFDLYTKVRPGVTGLWQVSGRNNTTYQERIEFDEYYVKNWSVWLDVYILGRTIKAVLLADGAY
jgi:Undecaprenyl-phosphate galactose phosphotransferase WbaP